MKVKAGRRLAQAVGDGTVLEPPFSDECFAARLDLLARRRVDHVVVIGGDLLAQPLRRVRQQVPCLCTVQALDRHAVPHGGDRVFEPRCAIDDEEFGPPEATLDEIVEHRTPGPVLSPPYS